MNELEEQCRETVMELQAVLAALTYKLGGLVCLTEQELRAVAGLSFNLHLDERGQALVMVMPRMALALPEVTHMAPEAIQ